MNRSLKYRWWDYISLWPVFSPLPQRQTHLECFHGSWDRVVSCQPVDCGLPDPSYVYHAIFSCPSGTTFGKQCSFTCGSPAILQGKWWICQTVIILRLFLVGIVTSIWVQVFADLWLDLDREWMILYMYRMTFQGWSVSAPVSIICWDTFTHSSSFMLMQHILTLF